MLYVYTYFLYYVDVFVSCRSQALRYACAVVVGKIFGINTLVEGDASAWQLCVGHGRDERYVKRSNRYRADPSKRCIFGWLGGVHRRGVGFVGVGRVAIYFDFT